MLIVLTVIVCDSFGGPFGLFGRRGGNCPGGKCPTTRPGDPQPKEPRPYVVRVRAASTGSGVIVNWQGKPYIVSAWHVAKTLGAATIKVDGGVYRAVE